MTVTATLINKYFRSAIPMFFWGLLTIAVLAFASTGCQEKRHDINVDEINSFIMKSPHLAIDSIKRIDTTNMQKHDKMLIKLLTIKAKDKAYITHTSDSIIKEVINYYSENKDKDLTPEALYYGGRVYYDLGDYPASLSYFRKALDLLPEDTRNLELRGNVLSQMGGTLNDLGLYSEAIPYLEQVIKLDELKKDSINLILDQSLLGDVFLHLRDTGKAKSQFMTALAVAKNLALKDTLEIFADMAVTYYYENNINTALTYIRKALNFTDTLSRNYILAIASKIYYKANVLDSAYLYSHELATSKNLLNKKTGYMIMLSPELINFIPKDSIRIFYSDYKTAIEKHFQGQEDRQILVQNAMYNYTQHDLAKQRAEKKEQKIKEWTIVLIFIILILCISILFYAYWHKKRLLELHEALAKIRQLEESLKSDNFSNNAGDISDTTRNLDVSQLETLKALKSDTNQLKEQLRKSIASFNDNNFSLSVNSSFIDTDIYRQLCSHISDDKAIRNDNQLWSELENEITKASPLFKDRLLLLSDENLKDEDFHLAMLIKFGFAPAQIAILLSKTKGAITYRRKKLCQKILGENVHVENIDAIIHSL